MPRRPQAVLDKIAENRAMVIAAKSRPCADCKRSYHHSQMQFDHLPSNKKRFGMHDYGARSTKTVQAEMAKCEVVCANCHHLRSWNRLHPGEEVVWPTSPV